MPKKYSDEELSRILSACDAGQLTTGGCGGAIFAVGLDTPCCINQAAYLVPSCGDAVRENPDAAIWFDDHYGEPTNPDPDKLLSDLVAQGLA